MKKFNGINERIKFTCEEEKDGQLPFLDLLLERKDGGIVFDIYRKPTDAPLCIPNHSHHPITHKLAAFESALYRMWAVPLDRDKREKELKYIVQMSLINGYKEETILRLNEKHKRRKQLKDFTTLEPQKKDRKRRTQDRIGVEVAKNLVIPYFAPLTEKFENLMRSQSLNVCYQNKGSLRDCIGVVKDITPEIEKAGIYKILCENCLKLYYGQTKRRKDERDKEHDRAIRLNHPDLSAVAKHCLENHHQKGSSQLVKTVAKPWELHAWESLFIHKTKEENLMNIGESPINSQLFKFAHKK